jgi:hypothetical protein
MKSRSRRLIRPAELTTRCHGTTRASGPDSLRSAEPTARIARGLPSIAAICP